MKNVLLVITDDQRYNTIHALGNPDIRTPNLDWLAQHGVAFTQAHIPGGTVGAVCMPSRAMLHAGRSLFHIQGEGQDIPEDHTTLAEVFRQAGYDCFGTGKWHNGPPAFARGFTGGDNIFFGGMWDHWNVPVNRYDPTGEYDNVINFVANFTASNEVRRVHCDKFHPGVHSSELLTQTAVDYLNSRQKGEKPFFLYLAYLAPHDPRTMPQRFKEMYDPEALHLPGNCWTEHPFSFGLEGHRDEMLAKYPREEAEVRRNLADYYGMISHLDEQLGRILDTLRSQGELENTRIVFAGDNGLAVGCHGLMGKQNNYDHSIRVPLLYYDADLPAERRGGTADHYVYLMDIFPTLCEVSGLPVPASVEGRSFAPMLQDPSFQTRDTLYFAYKDILRSVKDERYKLLEYRGTAHRTQLFDLKNDPEETRDLSEDPAMQGQVARLRDLLQAYRREWEDTGHPCTEAYWSQYGE